MKAILAFIRTTICGYFVYIVSIKICIILLATWAPKPWLSCESPLSNAIMSALVAKWVKPGADFICVLHSYPAVVISSVTVYLNSDGRGGE